MKILGILAQEEGGEYVFIPTSVSTAARDDKIGKIVKQPDPESAAIAKERETDYNLEARIKKHGKSEKKV